MGKVIKLSGAAVLGLALMAQAGPLSAQSTSIEQAAQLESRAQSLLTEMDEWASAARLYQQAAELRPEGDPKAIEDLLQAAKLTYYTGNEGRAVRALEAAGDRALNEGDVMTAATAFADAAWIAKDEGMGEKALNLVSRAQRLTYSPLLDDSQRRQLQERFDTGPTGP